LGSLFAKPIYQLCDGLDLASERVTPQTSPVAAAAAAPAVSLSDGEVLGHERRREREMSYMRGDLLTKTRKLVKGLAKPAPRWLKAMEESVHSYPTPRISTLRAFPPAFLRYSSLLAAIGVRSARKLCCA
jgi:hypothetical protein